MRPLLIGIILFLAWLIISSWYYAKHIFPVGNAAEETVLAEPVADTLVPPPKTIVMPEVPADITLYFDLNKTVILNKGVLNEKLDSYKEYLEADSMACLLITGHTCDLGTNAYNQGLGDRRALSVQSYFKDNGLSDACMLKVSKGETEPALPNTDEANRMKNRRVVVHVKN